MSYSPVCKSKKKKSNNESFLEDIRNSIDKEYRKATQSDDWSNYSFVYEAYYNYRLNGGCSYYIKAIVEKYKNQYERQQSQKDAEKLQYDALLDVISVALNGTANTEKTAKQEVSNNVSIESVNKEIDDLLNFIESYKQARYNVWKEEFYNGTRLR